MLFFPILSHSIFHSISPSERLSGNQYVLVVVARSHNERFVRRSRATRSHMFSSAIYRHIIIKSWGNRCSVCREIFSALLLLLLLMVWHGGTSQLRTIRRMIYMCVPYSFQRKISTRFSDCPIEIPGYDTCGH